MAKFGLDKSVPGQGGVAAPNTAPSRVTDAKPKSSGTTPGLGQDWAKNTNMRPAPQSASGSKGSPKPFKKQSAPPVDEDDEATELVPYAPTPFSWFMLATDALSALSDIAHAVGEFAENTAINFAHAHNRALEDAERHNDGEKFASDIMSGLETL